MADSVATSEPRGGTSLYGYCRWRSADNRNYGGGQEMARVCVKCYWNLCGLAWEVCKVTH